MIIFAADDFTGTNGSAPNATYWATGGGDTAGASETIQGNRLRVNTGTLTGYAGQAAAKFIGSRPGNTIDLTVTFNTSSTTDSNCEIWVNSTDAPFSSANGYFLPVGPPASGTIQMLKAVGASYSSIGGTKSFTINSNTDYTARIYVGGVGPVTIRWKIWLASDPEPIAWDAQFTDTSNFNSGFIYLHPIGGSAAGGYTDFDNVLITDGGDPYGGLYVIRPPTTATLPLIWTIPKPATPVLSLPPNFYGAEELRIPTAADTGSGVVGLAATSAAKKIVTATAVASLGASGLATAATVRSRTGTATLGLAGVVTARKAAPGAGTAALGLAGVVAARKTPTPSVRSLLGLAGTSTAVHVGRPSATGCLGLAGLTTARRIAGPSGSAALGLAGSGAGKKVMARSGVAALGLTGVTTARKVGVTTLRGALGLTGVTTARKVSTPTGPGVVGLAGSDTARKIVTGAAGQAFLGLFGTGSLGRPVAASGSLGLTAWASPSRKALPAASAALGLVGRGTAARVAASSARSALGLVGTGAGVHRATATGRAHAGLSGVGGARHVATASGRSTVALAGTGAGRKVVGLGGVSSLGLAGVQAISTRFVSAVAALGLGGSGAARKKATTTGRAAVGLSGEGGLLLFRSVVARAFLGITAGLAERVFKTERRPQGQTGGWVTLRTIQEEARLYADPGRALACPICGEPLIGDWCPNGAVHVRIDQPPSLTEDQMSDPGPWESLVGILRDAGSNAVEESRTPEVACPRCGEPLVLGHCAFDGYQTERPQE